jgi:hypothetical protein
MKWLTHSHDDKICHPLIFIRQMTREVDYLFHDLTWSEVAFKAHLTRGTKNTTHRAPDYRRYTNRPSSRVAQQNSFN